jgi:hypothetical protein
LTVSTICAILGAVFSIKAIVSVEALKQSTHQVEYVPYSPKEVEKFQESLESDQPLDPDDDYELNLSKVI